MAASVSAPRLSPTGCNFSERHPPMPRPPKSTTIAQKERRSRARFLGMPARLKGGRPGGRSSTGIMKTETERKKSGEKSVVIVERLVRAQLRAMGCERFDLGVRRDGGEMILREGQDAFAVAEAVKWLRHENAKGAHVYIRPAGTHSLSLLDDLSAEAIERMKEEGSNRPLSSRPRRITSRYG